MSNPDPDVTPDNPPPDSPTSSSSSEVRSARIAAYAAILGAVLGVAASGIGAGVSGYFTASATDKQITAAAAENTATFLRTQQQSVYASVLIDEQALREVEQQAQIARIADSGPLSAGAVGNVGYLAKDVDACRARLSKLQQDIASARLIGSSTTVSAASDLLSIHESFDRLLAARFPISEADTDQDAINRLGLIAFQLLNQMQGKLDSFESSARVDLGA